MNNQPSDERANELESLWRRKLSGTERAELRARPELELEARLTEALGRISDAPVSSNFTARVLKTIELEDARATRHGWHWNWRSLLPRLAVATAVLVFAGISLQRHQVHSNRVILAKNVAKVAVALPPPSVEALENFAAIRRMGESSHADGELLAALQ